MLDQSFQPANEFRTLPGSFGQLRNKLLVNMSIPAAIVLGLMSWFASGGATSMWIMLIAFPLIIGFSFYNAIKRQEKQFYSYRLIVTPEGVQREQNGMPSIFIPREEIRKILKSTTGAISIMGRNKFDALIVYAQIERPAELEQLLQAFAPIEVRQQTLLQKLSMLLLLVVVAAAYGTFAIDNLWLSGFALLVFTVCMAWSLVVTYMSSNIPKRTKYTMWIVLLPTFSIISGWLTKWELW